MAENGVEAHSAPDQQAQRTGRSPGRPVTTPKKLAIQRLTKLREHVSKTRERMRGFGLDHELADLESVVAALEGIIETKADDFKPSRASRQGPQVASGESYRLKDDCIKKYFGTLPDAPTDFLISTVIDSTQVKARFTDGTIAIIKRADIGDKIGG
jgi:hypothetical protein